MRPNNSNVKIFNDIEILQNEYHQLDEPYSKYVKYERKFRFLFLRIDKYSSHSPDFINVLNSDKIELQKKLDKALDKEMNRFDNEIASIKDSPSFSKLNLSEES